MKNNTLLLMAACLLSAAAARGAVTMSFSNTQPFADGVDQFSFDSSAAIPGTSPFNYNSQAFSQSAGPPGQTFNTPNLAQTFPLVSISLKGANTGAGSFGGGVFDAGQTWSIRVSTVFGTTLVPLLTVTNIPTTVGADGTNWYTWRFTGSDQLVLLPGKAYAFEVFSSAGYLAFDASTNATAYTGGVAFNSASGSRQFNNTAIQDRGYDRTFHVDLVPEPGSILLAALGGGLLLGLGRFRR